MTDKKIAKSKRRQYRPVRPVEESVLTDPTGLGRFPKSVVDAAVTRLHKLGFLEDGLYKSSKGESLKRDLNRYRLERTSTEPRPVIENIHYTYAQS